MEHESHDESPESITDIPGVRSPETSAERAPEVRRIWEGIAEALRDGTAIDHETAWLIAKAIEPGSGSLHELAMSGEISADIDSDLETAYEVLPELADTWIAALDGYCWRRRDKGLVKGWPGASANVDGTDG